MPEGFLKKIQKLPLKQRKMIFWTIVGVFGLIYFLIFIYGFEKKIKNMAKVKFQVPKISTPLFGFENETSTFPINEYNKDELIKFFEKIMKELKK